MAEKPLCKYGNECYRKNPAHFEQFSHPERSELRTEDAPPVAKRAKLADNSTAIVISDEDDPNPDDIITSKPLPHIIADEDEPRGKVVPFYLTKVRGISGQYNESHMAIGIKDILSTGDLIASVQFNYMFDIAWLVHQYPEKKRNTPILIVHGDQRNTTSQLQREAQPYPNVKLFPAKLNTPFGTHHSKMMLLRYRDGVRVVIHTANLIQKDWDQKTQGVWFSPIFPKYGDSLPSSAASESENDFKKDLIEYLEAYGNSPLKEWIDLIREHDTSEARVRLIASVPGAHTGGSMNKWGHLKLRKVLSDNNSGEEVDEEWPVIGQFSSVGSLGPSSSSWLCSEWLLSLSSTKKKAGASLHKYPNLKLIFPSVSNVKSSLEGYMAGGSIPYGTQTAHKQPYFTAYLHQWKAEYSGRSRAAPHIKTYCRLSKDNSKVAWFLLTSANLSKAAWGGFEKKGTQLRIRSYEIGTLFLPSHQNPSHKYFQVKPQDTSKPQKYWMPFDVPLTPYNAEDQPWIWDAKYMEPDSCGNIWTPS